MVCPGGLKNSPDEGRFIMGLAFFPSRDNMMKEIKQWVALRRVEMLHSLCNCCTYKQFDYTMSRDCRSCSVLAGIHKLVHEKKRETVECDELLGVC
jgi:hypothetical protein